MLHSIESKQRWGKAFIDNTVRQSFHNPFINHSEDLVKAVRTIEHAVISRQPHIRYRPGWQANLLFILTTLLPDWLIDRLLLANAADVLPAGVQEQC